MSKRKTLKLEEQVPDTLRHFEALAKEHQAITEQLLKDNPGLGITAFVIASDIQSARRATEAVKNKLLKPVEALNLVGSYARFDWAIEHLTEAELFQRLPQLWSGSDPDDTKIEYLELWRRARAARGQIITDGQPLPPGQYLEIHRGQRESDPVGYSWSLSKKVAARFAMGAGLRRLIDDGILLSAEIDRRHVLAYLTGRGEQEVIINLPAIKI